MQQIIILSSLLLLLVGCGNSEEKKQTNTIALGKAVFAKNCVVCHGVTGKGLTKDWRKPVNDQYPAPPLNGTAHAWHHSPKILLGVINNGGARLGGRMPAFNNKLTNEEKQGLVDYIYSLWPSSIQQKYDKRFK